MKLFKFTRKSSANNYRLSKIDKLVKEVVIIRFYFKMQLLLQDAGEFIFQQDCHSAHDVIRLMCGTIFNDHFIANFQEIVSVKEF